MVTILPGLTYNAVEMSCTFVKQSKFSIKVVRDPCQKIIECF